MFMYIPMYMDMDMDMYVARSVYGNTVSCVYHFYHPKYQVSCYRCID